MALQTGLRLGVAIPPVAAVGVSVVIVAVGLAAPLAQALLGHPSGEFFYDILFPICHQYPTRSIWILGQPCGLCARCLGGYVGVVMLSLLYFSGVLRRTNFGFFLVLSISLITFGVGDAVFKFVTGIDGSNAWRFGTGLLGGLGFAILIALPWKKFSLGGGKAQ